MLQKCRSKLTSGTFSTWPLNYRHKFQLLQAPENMNFAGPGWASKGQEFDLEAESWLFKWGHKQEYIGNKGPVIGAFCWQG